MKKWISIILCICLLLTGCNKGKEEDPVNERPDTNNDQRDDSDVMDETDDKTKVDEDDKQDDIIIPDDPLALRLNKEWGAVTLAG
ncbi:MAG: hypothetical protein PHC56_11110, partial [Herbinix sp.]|nr:hypothetical protein [Herbinix sp.]